MGTVQTQRRKWRASSRHRTGRPFVQRSTFNEPLSTIHFQRSTKTCDISFERETLSISGLQATGCTTKDRAIRTGCPRAIQSLILVRCRVNSVNAATAPVFTDFDDFSGHLTPWHVETYRETLAVAGMADLLSGVEWRLLPIDHLRRPSVTSPWQLLPHAASCRSRLHPDRFNHACHQAQESAPCAIGYDYD